MDVVTAAQFEFVDPMRPWLNKFGQLKLHENPGKHRRMKSQRFHPCSDTIGKSYGVIMPHAVVPMTVVRSMIRHNPGPVQVKGAGREASLHGKEDHGPHTPA